MRTFPIKKTNTGIKRLLQHVIWNMSKIGVNICIYYITVENTDFNHNNEDNDFEIFGFNLNDIDISKKNYYLFPEERDNLISKWFEDREPIFFAVQERKVIGFIAVKTRNIRIFNQKIGDNENDFYIHYIYVSPAHRGRGIAQRLRSEAFHAMKTIKTGKCYSYIDFLNKSATRSAIKSGADFLSLNIFMSLRNKRRYFRCRLRRFNHTA